MFGNRGKMRLSLCSSHTLTRLRHFVSPFIQCIRCGAPINTSSSPHRPHRSFSFRAPIMTINSSQNSPAKEPKDSNVESDKYILERNKVESER